MFLTRSWFQKRSRWTRQAKEQDPLQVRGVLAPTDLEHALCRERARADRNHQCFSLVVFRVIARRDDDLRRLTELLVERVRAYDVVGLVDGERIAVLLPETTGEDSWVFADAALAQLATEHLSVSCEVYSYPERAPLADDEGLYAYGRVPRGTIQRVPDEPDGEAGATGTTGPHATGPHATGPHASPAPESTPDGERRSTGTDGIAYSVPSPQVAPPVELSDARASLRATEPVAVPMAELHAAAPETSPRPIKALAPMFVEPLPFWRRAVDIAVSGTAILAISPVLVTTAILVKATSPGPIIFSQLRVGRGGRNFRFYKFRSMYKDAEARKNELRLVNEKDGPIFKIREDPRITPLGRVIRRLSIDELPQLFNVLKGDMTLVGPRPPVVDEVEQYQRWQRQRLDITGGLTCIWQVSGRSEVSFDDWMRMDIRYKQKRSVRMDLKLLWKTFGAVFSGRGAY